MGFARGDRKPAAGEPTALAGRRQHRKYAPNMGFTMSPAFFSTDLDRTSKFWGALGFAEVMRNEGYMILEHPMGIVIHFGLNPDLMPSKNMTNAYVRFSSSAEAVALHDEWVDRVSAGGSIHAPAPTPYGMVEWGMTDPDANMLRAGGPAESTEPTAQRGANTA